MSRQNPREKPRVGSLALWACRSPGVLTGVSEKDTLAVRQTSPVLDSGNNSLRSPHIRLGLVLGLGERPETVFTLYLLVSSKMPDSVALID